MSPEKPSQADREDAERQLAEWILARCDIEDVPKLVELLEIAKPKSVVDRLMAALTRHRRQKMLRSPQRESDC